MRKYKVTGTWRGVRGEEVRVKRNLEGAVGFIAFILFVFFHHWGMVVSPPVFWSTLHDFSVCIPQK